MKGRAVTLILIPLAVVTYLAAVGCVMWPTAAPVDKPLTAVAEADPPRAVAIPAAQLDTLPMRGVVLQVQRIDSPDVYHKAIDDISALGADTVEIAVDSRQENGTSSMIFLDMRMSPSPEKLADLIKYAKGKGLRVILMPIVLIEKPRGNEWRGTIKPESWDDWFGSYREVVRHYAQAAEAGGADVFVVGSELLSTEMYRDQWLRTIHEVRRLFHGMLTYSANWDHYRSVQFWDQLDLVSTNSYYKLGENRDVSVEEIVTRWRAIQKDLLPWVHGMHKPFMFTEVGWCSVANAAHEPWDYTQQSVPIDQDLQRKLYEGFFKAWYGEPQLGGFNIWQWTPGGGGPDDRNYTPAGKPAEKVLRDWLAKPRWKANP
ncbi:MAG: hypothetical protein JWL69_2936 [Phycisphaerales bacterium]|nr:hypothetical protein [Phycisphaerales bacterium]